MGLMLFATGLAQTCLPLCLIAYVFDFKLQVFNMLWKKYGFRFPCVLVALAALCFAHKKYKQICISRNRFFWL